MALNIERYKGFIVRVGEAKVKVVNLPDWELNYIAFPSRQKVLYRDALMHEGARIVKVTEERIYFQG